MSFFKKPQGAVIVLILTVLISSTVSAVISINKQAAVVNQEFFTGYGDNMNIYNDLQDKASFSSNLNALATNHYQYVKSDDSHLSAINQACTIITTQKDIAKLYAAMSSLDSNVDWLISTLQGKVTDSTDLALLKKYKTKYDSATVTINSDPYNGLVLSFENETNGILGNLFKKLATPVAYFR